MERKVYLPRYEEVRIPLTAAHGGYLPDCRADLHYGDFSDIVVEELAALGASEVLLDLDGTLTAQRASRISLPKTTSDKIEEINAHERLRIRGLATENMAYPEDLLSVVGLEPTTFVFQPFGRSRGNVAKTKITKAFWLKILFELDCLDSPSDVVMIGDSLARDIKPSQDSGFRTVLVDRLVNRPL